MNYEIWTLPNSASFKRKQDITQWVLAGTEWDVRLLDLPAGQLIVHRNCPFLDEILTVDRANHANDVGSTLMIFDEGDWVGAMVPTEREDDAGSEDAPVVFTLEGLEWFMDRARVEAFDHPANPMREADWIYGHPTILLPAGGEVSDARWSLYVDGATSGSYTISDGTDTTDAIDYDESDPSVIATRLETDIAAINEVVVSGAGTSANEFFIRLTDPAATDLSLSVSDSTNGTVVLSKTTTGGTPSPRPWHGSVDGNSGEVIGTYESFEMVAAGSGSVPSAPSPAYNVAGTASTYLLKVDADTPAGSADYAGAQVEVSVIPGHRYRGKIRVYSETAQRIRFIIRTLSENEIAADDQNVSADTWTELSVAFTVPDGVETVVYRVGIVVDGNADVVYMDVSDAIFAPGVDAAPVGEIANDLLAPMQARSVLDWWTETYSDTQDSTSENWDRDLSQRIRRGQSFMQFLEYQSRWGYERELRWDGTNWDFGLYNPGNLGTDYTGQGGPTVSFFDGGIGSSPLIQRVPDFTTAIAEGDAGVWGEHTDATLATGWGRLEGYFANRQGTGSLDALAEQMVTDTDGETDSARLTVRSSSVRPLVDVKVGDTVPTLIPAADGSLVPKMRRCVQIAVSETETAPTITYHFGSPVYDAETATQEALRTLIRRYQALDSLGEGGGVIDPFLSKQAPQFTQVANAGLGDTTRGTHDGTGATFDFPEGIVEGSVMVLLVKSRTANSHSASGWTELWQEIGLSGSNAVDLSAWYRVVTAADVSAGQGTFVVDSGANDTNAHWQCMAFPAPAGVSFTDTPPESAGPVAGDDPPPISPTFAPMVSRVAVVRMGAFGIDDDEYPVGYTRWGSAATSSKLAVGQALVSIETTENPSAFQVTSSNWFFTATIAVAAGGEAALAAGVHTHRIEDLVDDAGLSTGDLLYSSDGVTISRLPVGSGGQVLKVSGGLPAWGTDLTSGGGSAGTLVGTSSDSGASPLQVPVVGGIQDGDLIVLAGGTVNSTPNAGGPSGTWNEVLRFDTSSGEYQFVYWKIASSESGTWDLTHSAGSEAVAAAAVFRGVDSVWSQGFTADTLLSPSILGSGAGLLVLIWFSALAGGNMTDLAVPSHVTSDIYAEAFSTNSVGVLIGHRDTVVEAATGGFQASGGGTASFHGVQAVVFYEA